LSIVIAPRPRPCCGIAEILRRCALRATWPVRGAEYQNAKVSRQRILKKGSRRQQRVKKLPADRRPEFVRELQTLRAKLPISNKLLGSSTVKFPIPARLQAKRAFAGWGCSIMRHLFAVTPSRPTLLGVVVLTILVFGAFVLLKNTSGGRQAPTSELITGSIPKAVSVLKPISNDQMAVFLSPASTQLTALVQSIAVDRGPVPLPRPRPKRL